MRRIFAVRNTVVAVLLTGVFLTGATVQGENSRVSDLKVERDSNGSPSFVISKSGAVQVREFRMQEPPRLVVDLVGAVYGMSTPVMDGDGVYVDRVRSSQFTTSPELVTRVVFDLKGTPDYRLQTRDDCVTVAFSGAQVSAETPTRSLMESAFETPPVRPMIAGNKSAQAAPAPETAADRPAASVEAKSSVARPAPRQASPVAEAPSPKPLRADDTDDTPMLISWDMSGAAEESDEPAQEPAPRPMVAPQASTLPTFAAGAGLVANKNITIDVQEADVQTVIRSFSEFSGINIIAGPEVEGEVTAHLKNVPWRHAMDIILKSHGFGYREEYGMIRVSTIDQLTKEELEVQAAERQRDDLLPLETRIIALSFANATEIKDALKDILSQRGSIQVEQGVNSLIVNDIGKNIEKIAAMVADLDRKLRQVEIVAKLVDVDFDATREIGVRWDLLNLAAQDVNAVGDFTLDARSANPVGTFRVGSVQSWGEVQAIIDMLEKENKANIISNPRIVTADNREASILVGKEIPLIVSDEAGNPITELTKIGIILRVTPHVNLDNTITLDLHPEVSDLSAQATVQGGVVIVMSEADTRVVVGNGETAVIGGLISEAENRLESGVPFLKDLPLLGGLFRLTSENNKKRELVIFVTPKLIES
jgi:type IV pilus assembly protein PilQ